MCLKLNPYKATLITKHFAATDYDTGTDMLTVTLDVITSFLMKL